MVPEISFSDEIEKYELLEGNFEGSNKSNVQTMHLHERCKECHNKR